MADIMGMNVVFYKTALLIFVVSTLSACVGVPNNIIGVDGLTVSARDVPKSNRHRIFIATTRATSKNPAIMFSGNRGSLKFAQIDVSIPPAHQLGKIERAVSLPPDPRKNFVALDPKILLNQDAFISALNARLAELPPDYKNALVFIHGYNTSFDEALFRLAQFVNDSNYKGIAILFTWPSSGNTRDYLYDLNSALASRDELLTTLKIVGRANIESGDILAHSMGAILTIEALRQAALKESFAQEKRTKLRYIVLASPDIDAYLFAKQIKLLPVDMYEFFTLISRDDKALNFSKFLSGGISRVGGAEVSTLKNLGVTIVDLTDVKDSTNSHSKFAGSPEIVQALGRSLNVNKSVGNEARTPASVKIIKRVIEIPSVVLKNIAN